MNLFVSYQNGLIFHAKSLWRTNKLIALYYLHILYLLGKEGRHTLKSPFIIEFFLNLCIFHFVKKVGCIQFQWIGDKSGGPQALEPIGVKFQSAGFSLFTDCKGQNFSMHFLKILCLLFLRSPVIIAATCK
jgi:hypothetical protein